MPDHANCVPMDQHNDWLRRLRDVEGDREILLRDVTDLRARLAEAVVTAAWSEPQIRAAFSAVTYTVPDDGGYAVDRVDVDDLITELKRAEEKPKMRITIHPSPPQVQMVPVLRPCPRCGHR